MPTFPIYVIGVDDEDSVYPYATFHLLGFREEMDPTKAINFQTFPHQAGGPIPYPPHTMQHQRAGSQSMVNSSFAD